MRAERQQRIERMLGQRLQSLTIVAEGLYLRHNVSAIMRSAEAFGIHDVHLITDAAQAHSGAARGAERWVELHRHLDTESCLASLKKEGFRVVVADLQPGALTPEEIPVEGKLALFMGTELGGVSERARQMADDFVRIPMRGLTQSLNVSVAAACLLFRLSERKRAHIGGGDLSAHRQKLFLEHCIRRDLKARVSLKKRMSP